MIPRYSRQLAFLPLLTLVHAPAFAFSVFTVGPGADCPYHSIQDAVDAAAGTAGVDYVWISNDLASGARYNYTGQHIHVNDPDGVLIEGGFTSCSDYQINSNETTTISGAGNDGGPVFDISGAGAFLGNLYITGANRDGNSYGGGVYYNATGQTGDRALYLSNTSVSINRAGYGGGIDVEGYASPAQLVLEGNTLVLNNYAQNSGGGIRIAGNVRLFATAAQTWIGLNTAGGDGGGLNVVGPARADVGSPGYNGVGVISGNTAQFGGGVSVYAGAPVGAEMFSVAQARFFTVDPNNPVQISDNTATSGGGAFVQIGSEHDCGASRCADEADVCLFDARVNDNIAQQGAVTYGALSSGTELFYANQAGYCGPEPPPALGAVACAPGVDCNELNDNINEDGSGNPTAGSTIEMADDGLHFSQSVQLERMSMRGNHAQHVFGSSSTGNFGGSQDFTSRDSLIAGNVLSGEVISFVNGHAATVDRSTIAGNSIGTGFVLLIDGDLGTLTNSIIDQPGHSTLDFNSASNSNLTANYVLATETFELGTRTGVMQGEPTFVDAANGNYRLAYGSLGIDFAPAGTSLDLDRKPRTVDLPSVNDLYGPMDLGAYELQTDPVCSASDDIFCNGFESTQ
jgi:hypothetical protein